MKDVLVVGAGIMGASVAYHLTDYEDVRVTIVDAGHPGSGATIAGTGWIAATRAQTDHYFQLGVAAMEEHHRLHEVIGGNWLRPGGSLIADNAIPDFDGFVASLRVREHPLRVVSPEEVSREYEPKVKFPGEPQRIAYLPQDFAIEGARLANILVDAAIDRGAMAHYGARVENAVILDNGKHEVWLSDDTRFVVDALVNAAGARADSIASFYDVPMQLEPRLGLGVLMRAGSNPLDRIVWGKGIVLKPERDGVIRVRSTATGWRTNEGVSSLGTSVTGGLDRTTFAQRLAEETSRMIPSLGAVQPLSSYLGVRPIPADGYPRVGTTAGKVGYFEAISHSGAVFAPLIGRLLAEEVATGVELKELQHYRPQRFEGVSS